MFVNELNEGISQAIPSRDHWCLSLDVNISHQVAPAIGLKYSSTVPMVSTKKAASEPPFGHFSVQYASLARVVLVTLARILILLPGGSVDTAAAVVDGMVVAVAVGEVVAVVVAVVVVDVAVDVVVVAVVVDVVVDIVVGVVGHAFVSPVSTRVPLN